MPIALDPLGTPLRGLLDGPGRANREAYLKKSSDPIPTTHLDTIVDFRLRMMPFLGSQTRAVVVTSDLPRGTWRLSDTMAPSENRLYPPIYPQTGNLMDYLPEVIPTP